MEFRTSSYFFPSTRHRIKSQFRQSPLHSIQRKQIRENLSAYVSHQSHQFSNSPLKIKKSKTSQEASRDSSCRKTRTENAVPSQKIGSNNVGVYSILQKVKVMKTEQTELESNPFYKIQRCRKNSKGLPFHLNRKQEIQSKPYKLQFSSKEILANDVKLFQNEGLWEINNEQKPGKVRTKSQTVMYYEIKQYFQKKYGRQTINH